MFRTERLIGLNFHREVGEYGDVRGRGKRAVATKPHSRQENSYGIIPVCQTLLIYVTFDIKKFDELQPTWTH